jgi:hypothetical protein
MGDLLVRPISLANFSTRVCSFPKGGRRWVVQLPQLALWDRVRGDAALLESLFSPFVKGELLGQGVRLE